MKYKTCTSCKKKFPLTRKYFYLVNKKQKLVTGKYAIYKVYKSMCKKCHGLDGIERRRAKMCLVYNCSIHEYEKYSRIARAKTNTIDFLAKEELSNLQYIYYLRKRKIDGYNNVKEYLLKVEMNLKLRDKRMSKQQKERKWKYTKEDFNYANKIARNKITEKLTDGYICNQIFKTKIENIPKGIIEVRREIIKIKREIKTQLSI